MNRKEILNNILNEEERLFAAKAIDKMELSKKIYSPAFTEFTDPFKAHYIKNLLLNNGCEIEIYGGYNESERVKIGFFDEFSKVDLNDFPISAVEISYNRQYSRELTHRDFLGSVLGLGIVREKTGDIVIEENRGIIFVDSDIADYIVFNLERVGHTKVKTRIIENYKPKMKDAVSKNITVSSLRLDSVTGGALNLSRGKTVDHIKGEKVFVNWKKETSASFSVKEGDVITLRGVGRVKINEVIGNTKKDRVLINISIYK